MLNLVNKKMLVKTAFRPAYQQIYQRFLVFPNELRCTLLSLKMLRISILQKSSSFLNCLCAPPGARTLDPNIKSVVLYQLS